MSRLAFPTMLRNGVLTGRVVLLTLLLAVCNHSWAADAQVALKRAVGYLAAEVPRWHRENRCYSCHNNGDALRALLAASRAGMLANAEPLKDTLVFLGSPQDWDANGPDGPFKDEKLARIQFAAALVDATAGGFTGDRSALVAAADKLAEQQREDGAWPSDAEGTLGSPVTYGEALATAISLRTLRLTDARRFAANLQRGRAWFAAREPHNILDACATLLGLDGEASVQDNLRRQEALKLIEAGQAGDGGWGPFVNSPPEVFDTALVLIALRERSSQQRTPAEARQGIVARIDRGRQYLLAHQNTDGSWPATTRPPGVDSYAQQVSTTGWALQALLVTSGAEPKNREVVSPAECK